MTDFQNMRSRVRETGYEPERKSGVPFWIFAVCAIVVGFTVVLFVPRFYTVQRTAALPTFRDMTNQPPLASAQDAGGDVSPATARYAGKGVEEIGRIADSVCMQRASSRLLAAPSSSISGQPLRTSIVESADENDRLVCRLTEAPERYCSSSQRQKIAAEAIDYFNAIGRNSAALRTATTEPFPADPRVMEGVDGLIRAGYFPKATRGDIDTSVPRAIRERFDRIVPVKSHCPAPPWWAFWRQAS
jgi:hypothetical protein